MDKPFLKDIKLTRRNFNTEVSDRQYVDLINSTSNDLMTIEGRENLAQAIINRLLTRKGELKKLGHPNYGSRLYLLVGEANNTRVRGMAELYIRESLSQEKRIKEITRLDFELPSNVGDRSVLKTHIGVQPIGDNDEFALNIPINL